MTEYDISNAAWISSRFCSASACVQVAHLPGGRVAIRDSKNTAGPAYVFDREEWAAFITGVRAGDFDLPQ